MIDEKGAEREATMMTKEGGVAVETKVVTEVIGTRTGAAGLETDPTETRTVKETEKGVESEMEIPDTVARGAMKPAMGIEIVIGTGTVNVKKGTETEGENGAMNSMSLPS